MTIAITRTDLDASGLRLAAARSRDATASRRMLALALVLEGHTRTEAAQAAGMDRQTLRDWVHRHNEQGLAGLANLPNPGARPRKLTAEQEAVVAEWVRQGPTLEQHKVVRWRLVDLRDEIARKFGAKLHERTVGKLMARLNFSRVSVRPRHPKQDTETQETHKKRMARPVRKRFLRPDLSSLRQTLPTWSSLPIPSTHAANRSNSGGKTKPASASKAA